MTQISVLLRLDPDTGEGEFVGELTDRDEHWRVMTVRLTGPHNEFLQLDGCGALHPAHPDGAPHLLAEAFGLATAVARRQLRFAGRHTTKLVRLT